jgi:hypothetical protein
MARRGWARSIFLTILAAAGTAAAQFGLGYGLGIIGWSAGDATPAGSAEAAAAWTTGLAWATWVSATSVVIGAVIGDRVRGPGRGGRLARSAGRVVLALAATLGSLIALPLVAVPASEVHIVDNFAPHLLAGIYVAAGAVLGLVVALVATASRAVAANVIASAGWLWALAVVATVDGRLSGRGHGYTQLAVWKFTSSGPLWQSYYIPGALLMLGTALLVGGLTAFPAAGRADGRLGVAISGAVGPLLVLGAYLLARPNPADAPVEQLSAYHSAPLMVAAGLIGSLLVAAVGGGFSRSPKENSPPPATARPNDPTQALSARVNPASERSGRYGSPSHGAS